MIKNGNAYMKDIAEGNTQDSSRGNALLATPARDFSAELAYRAKWFTALLALRTAVNEGEIAGVNLAFLERKLESVQADITELERNKAILETARAPWHLHRATAQMILRCADLLGAPRSTQ